MKIHPVHWLYAVLGIGSFFFASVIRPWHLRWGTTQEEFRRPLPGDEFVPTPAYRSKRAITIESSPQNVWPWLLQLGQGRGGFYSYDWLENLLGLDIHSVDRIVLELQDLKAGDFVAAEPKHEFGWVVSTLDAPNTMVLRVGSPHAGPAERGSFFDGGISGVWSFALEPNGEHETRLIVGFRADWEPNLAADLFKVLLLEPAHFIMEREMLRGIKQRADRRSFRHHSNQISARERYASASEFA